MGPPLSPQKMEAYVKQARKILLDVARKRRTITYQELMDRMGGKPGKGYIGQVVGRVSEIDFEQRGIKLSALVARDDTKTVGGGFFGLPGTPVSIKRTTPQELEDSHLSEADKKYWQSEKEKVYRYASVLTELSKRDIRKDSFSPGTGK